MVCCVPTDSQYSEEVGGSSHLLAERLRSCSYQAMCVLVEGCRHGVGCSYRWWREKTQQIYRCCVYFRFYCVLFCSLSLICWFRFSASGGVAGSSSIFTVLLLYFSLCLEQKYLCPRFHEDPKAWRVAIGVSVERHRPLIKVHIGSLWSSMEAPRWDRQP